MAICPFVLLCKPLSIKGGGQPNMLRLCTSPKFTHFTTLSARNHFMNNMGAFFLPTLPSRSSLAIVAFWPKSSQGNSYYWAKHNICANIIINIKASNTLLANARQSFLFFRNPFSWFSFYQPDKLLCDMIFIGPRSDLSPPRPMTYNKIGKRPFFEEGSPFFSLISNSLSNDGPWKDKIALINTWFYGIHA